MPRTEIETIRIYVLVFLVGFGGARVRGNGFANDPCTFHDSKLGVTSHCRHDHRSSKWKMICHRVIVQSSQWYKNGQQKPVLEK